jgi:lon-related putative ATP-dependent protease
MAMVKPLGPASLYRRCDPDKFDFASTEDLEDIEPVIGQERAMEALDFGIGIHHGGYNLFAVGPFGIDKQMVVRRFLEVRAAGGDPPNDWCYVHNFAVPDRPRALELPAGRAREFRRDMEQLIEDLRNAIPVAFESGEYHARVREIEESYKDTREKALTELAAEADAHGLALVRTPGGFALAPVKDGEILDPEEYEKLPEAERQRIEREVAELHDKLATVLHQMPKWQRESRNSIKALDREVGLYAVGHLIDEIRRKYEDLPPVLDYLDAAQTDVIEHLQEFRSHEEPAGLFGIALSEKPSFRRYQVNVMVDNSETAGMPVIYEDTPLYQNLVGRVDHMTHMGALVTDFTLVKPGVLHRANGGYLVLDARKVLGQPYAWEGLKRALLAREVRIQSLGQIFSVISTVSLDPEPIPLDVKVVLLGERLLYYLMRAYDPDFSDLFKVTAEFEHEIDRGADNDLLYARLLATLARRESLRPLDRAAVARVIEHCARLAEDAEKLTARLQDLTDLLREADYWARDSSHERVAREDVEKAIALRIRRTDGLRKRIHENILRDIVMIDTDGARIGEINALSVIELGDQSFAQPVRVTANARLGEGEIVDIERESELGGAIHSKGVMILGSYLAARYCLDRPLSLSASLVFEQSYGPVEGDSASVAELCALLSVLAGVEIRQTLAITGSVNQHGEVQAIGGVNEKIEGFFDVCVSRELTGKQGVLIPAANIPHLMLRQTVVNAAAQGRFHIWPVRSIDEAMELLTGFEAGERNADGAFPDGSINHRVEACLREFADLRHEYGRLTTGIGEDAKP